LEILTGSDALVLDDLDKTRATEFAAEAVFLAIDQRADGAAPIMLTTNLEFTGLVGRWPAPYGEAIGSRIQLFQSLVVDGQDLRAAAARG
jgi:DNA replication protein DnaC